MVIMFNNGDLGFLFSTAMRYMKREEKEEMNFDGQNSGDFL